MTLNQLFTWYNNTLPVLIQTCDEDEVIRQFALANGTDTDFFSQYYQNPQRGRLSWPALSDELEEHLNDSKWTSLMALTLFSKEASVIDDYGHWPRHLNTQSTIPEVSWNQDIRVAKIFASGKVHLPKWMAILERFAILNKLEIINPMDDNWLWAADDDTQEPTCTISSVDHIGLDNVQDWGNLIPSDLFLYSDDTQQHRVKRHNIIIWEYMKRMAWAPLWQHNRDEWMAQNKRVPYPYCDTTKYHRGKWAALMLFQSIIYCRLLYYKNHSPRLTYMRPYMVEPDEGYQWIPSLATIDPTGGSSAGSNPIILVRWLMATPDQRVGVSKWDSFPVLLGNGSLVSQVVCAAFGSNDFSYAAYNRGSMAKINYKMSCGLIPQWMSLWLRSIPRPKHPALDEIYAGLVAVQNPEFGNSTGRNGKYLSGYYCLSPINMVTGEIAREGGYNDPPSKVTYLSEEASTSAADWSKGIPKSSVAETVNEGYRCIYRNTLPSHTEGYYYFTPDAQMFNRYPVYSHSDSGDDRLVNIPFMIA